MDSLFRDLQPALKQIHQFLFLLHDLHEHWLLEVLITDKLPHYFYVIFIVTQVRHFFEQLPAKALISVVFYLVADLVVVL